MLPRMTAPLAHRPSPCYPFLMSWIIAILFLFFVLWVWSPQDVFSDEITSYPAACADGTSLENCHIYTRNRTTYRINETRGEVVYRVIHSIIIKPRKLVDCAIMSRTDWSCSYPDGSGQVGFFDGRKTRNAYCVSTNCFYVRKWQWWYVRIMGNFIWPVKGNFLIPEQHDQ